MKFVIAGNYGAENIGDEMILEGMIDMIKAVSSKNEIVVLSGNPQKTASLYDVKSANMFPAGLRSFIKYLFMPNNTKKYLKECDYFILGGGGLFGSLTFRANIIWGIQTYMAYKYGKKVIMYGQSIGKINGKFRKWLIKRLFNKASLITVRDNKSKNTLQKIGVNKKIYIIPDMAFRKEEKIKDYPKKNTLIVALRHMNNLPDKFIQEISAFINWIIEKKNYKIKILNFKAGTGNDSDDIIHKKLIKNINKKDSYKYIQKIADMNNLYKEFSMAEIVLGMRFHSIITAIKTKKPFIAINYASKVENMLKDVEMDEYMLNPEDISFSNLKKLFLKIVEKKEEISKKLLKINEQNYEKHINFENSILRNFLLIDHKTQSI